MKSISLAVLCSFLLSAICPAQSPAPGSKSWITSSDSFTTRLIDLDKKYSPEFGSSEGLAAYDNQVAIPTLANQLAERKEEEALVAYYSAALTTEKQPQVAQDLKILITHLKQGFRRQDFELSREVPFFNAANTIYSGLQILLDDQTPAPRHAAALIRMRKYAGLEKGYQPITAILQERVSQQIAKGIEMIYPSKQQMEVELSRNAAIMDGIPELCKKFNLTGWEQPYATLKKQVADYDRWTRDHVMTKARTDFRLPAEEYALNLEDYGIDIPPAELAKLAHAAFTEIDRKSVV